MSLRALFLGLTAGLALTAAPALSAELPGFGDSIADPVGEPWVLPEGIELSATIESYDPFDPDACKHPDEPPRETPPKPVGVTGGLVRVCLQFTNNTNTPIKVPLLYGIELISESQEIQNGIIVQRGELEVQMDQPLFAPLLADCMNGSRSAPGIGARYRIGPITQHPHILEALRLLDDRDLTDPLDAAIASSLLKPLYLGKALTQDARDQIADLPARVPT